MKVRSQVQPIRATIGALHRLLRHRTIWLTAVCLLAVGTCAAPAAAQDPAAPTPTVTADPAEDDGGISASAPVLAAVFLAFALGIVTGVARRRRAPARPPATEAPAPPPAEPEPPEPPDAPEPEPRIRGERFVRSDPGPETGGEWTCEIRWKPGYAKSRFRAMARPPGGRRVRVIAESPTLRWTLMMDADSPTPDLVEAQQALVEILEAEGWRQTEPGAAWYAERYVWPESSPPRRLATPEELVEPR